VDTTIEVEHLAAPFGVELRGVDLSGSLDGVAATLRSLLDEHALLLVRGCDADALVRFGRVFGRVADDARNGTFYVYLSNTREDGRLREGALPFHSDFMFTPHPYLMIGLHALEIAPGAAPTRFASAVRACTLLPDELRERIATLELINATDFTPEGQRDFPRPRLLHLADAPEYLYPRARHAAIERHPRTGAEFLTAEEQQTSHFLGIPESEGEEILAALLDRLYAPDNVYEHHWAVGDLVLWDNVALQHGRPAWPDSAERSMRRICVCEHESREMLPEVFSRLPGG
jgi:taurine dioxygenase